MGFVYDLGRDLAKNGRTTKNDDSSSLLKVFQGLRDAFWRLFGNMFRHLGAILGYVGHFWALGWALLRYLVTRWSQRAPR